MAERYPLSWPFGWKRTERYKRKRAAFRSGGSAVTVAGGIKRLLGELGRLGVRDGDCIISTNVATRLDRLPYSNQREPDDPGAAVYFRLKKQDRVLACDLWTRVADNLTAIAQHIDALRRIDRYGVGTLEQAFAGYAALPAPGHAWRSVLGFAPDEAVTADKVSTAFRERARTAHPDVGGSHEQMAALTEARTEAHRFLEGR